ncbi:MULTISPECIES: DUF484 family protein [Thiomicrorhabdus]|uniref:DUF484 family protein n=1 Tax=Thiomicrorhabdus heinhorstiae TaxID=2748010 RepID=A0ABS0BVW3_9GAMM|nr:MULTISPECIES: DUF484 family protein [Thiomicrorhabdus]MBF6057958.1 DUF484 family protein [Thiomicrorhabdus heinhorstiae]
MREAALNEQQIADYLRRHPQFFHAYPELLNDLSIPHPQNGNQISLVERQISQLRSQRDSLKGEVDSMMSIAGENSALFQKVLQFTNRLIAASDESAAVEVVYEEMRKLFEVDSVHLVSWELPKRSVDGLSQLGISQTWVKALKSTLEVGQPVCGLLEDEWRKGLFREDVLIDSICLMPLGHERVWGVLALGSVTDRFHPELGTYFLGVMAELITSKFNQLFEA